MLFAGAFTLPDLMGLVRFYESPLGQRFVQAQFALTRQEGELTNRWGMRLAQEALRDMPDMAYVMSMKTDLRNLITAEEAYFADSVKYTDRLPARFYTPSTGNRLVTLQLTRDGWWAQMSNANTVKTCFVFIGSTPAAPATKEGEPQCR